MPLKINDHEPITLNDNVLNEHLFTENNGK